MSTRLGIIRILFTYFFFFYSSLLYSQQVTSISKPELTYQNDTLLIRYSFNQCDKRKHYKVWVDAKTVDGIELSTNSLSGDVGEFVPCNKNQKVIYWDLYKDSIFLDDAIAVKVLASINQHYRKPNYFLSSLALPGSGIMMKKQNHKPYWLMGVAGYAGVSLSLHFYLETKNRYRDYTQEQDVNRKQQLYESYQRSQNLMKTSMISTGSIWVVNLLWTLVAKSPEHPGITLHNNKSICLYASSIQGISVSGVSLKFDF